MDIIKVDIFDNEIGFESKVKCHEKPILHRAFSVFIYSEDKMLIQRRALDKYHSGGLWANACCSHPRISENLIEAAQNRLLEEVGISCPIKEVFSFVYMHKFEDDLFEYEFDHVFLGEFNGQLKLTDGEINPNPNEIEELQWIEFDKLEKQLLTSPEKFAPWFLIATPKVLEIVRREK